MAVQLRNLHEETLNDLKKARDHVDHHMKRAEHYATVVNETEAKLQEILRAMQTLGIEPE
jgi:hypothetical protein